MSGNRFDVCVSYKKLLLFILLMFVVHTSIAGSGDFMFTIDTRLSASDEAFTIPTYGMNYKYDVDCDDDGIFEAINQLTAYTCDYSVNGGGEKTIVIRGTTGDGSGFPRIRVNEFNEAVEIIKLSNWGDFVWDTMDRAFSGAVNMVVTATDVPDLSQVSSTALMFSGANLANPDTSGWNTEQVTNMRYMFFAARGANPDTSGWNTSQVTDMQGMFDLALIANPDTSGWNTGQVTDMSLMFVGAESANPNTSGWNTANVTDMSAMFNGADVARPDTSGWDTGQVVDMGFMFFGALIADPDTSGWNTSHVTDMNGMFGATLAADPDVSGFDTSAVTDMSRMFFNADLANPDTSDWDTSEVTDMGFMFLNATAANPDTESWDITNVITMERMFEGVTLPTADYDEILSNFSSQPVQQGVLFHGGNSQYCNEDDREILTNPSIGNWEITDGGLSSSCGDVIFKNSFDVPVVIFAASKRSFEYDFESLETVGLDDFPVLIGIGLNHDNQAIINFHVRIINDQLQIRVSELDQQAFEPYTWIDHQWQDFDSQGLIDVTW